MSTKTTNFEFIKPEDHGESWGDAIRSSFIKIDYLLVQMQGNNSSPGSMLQSHRTQGNHNDIYFTQDELNNGSLDTRYYTKTQLNAGQLDNLYYNKSSVYKNIEVYSKNQGLSLFSTQSEALDILFQRYYKKADIVAPLNGRYYSKLDVLSGNITSYKNAIKDLTDTKNQIIQSITALMIKPLMAMESVPYEIIRPITNATTQIADRLGDATLVFGQRIPRVTDGVTLDQLKINMYSWYTDTTGNARTGTKAPADTLYIMTPASKYEYGLKDVADSIFRTSYPNV